MASIRDNASGRNCYSIINHYIAADTAVDVNIAEISYFCMIANVRTVDIDEITKFCSNINKCMRTYNTAFTSYIC